MPRRVWILVTFAALAAVLAGALFSVRAVAGGPGYGPGPGPGPGMMGGYGPASQTASSGSATLLIRHQYLHCHTWSLDGGPFAAHQSVRLKRGSSLTVIDNDVMPHRLVELAGPRLSMRNGSTMPMMGAASGVPGLMSHMGASTAVTFAKPGVYRFRTRAGEDYRSGIETAGADNVLTLRVVVR